jgi:hypothetical protein
MLSQLQYSRGANVVLILPRLPRWGEQRSPRRARNSFSVWKRDRENLARLEGYVCAKSFILAGGNDGQRL